MINLFVKNTDKQTILPLPKRPEAISQYEEGSGYPIIPASATEEEARLLIMHAVINAQIPHAPLRPCTTSCLDARSE
jgi:hypothetical protein